MTNVIIHGELGSIFGQNHSFKIDKLSDIIKALNANNLGFKDYILTLFNKGIHYNVIDLKNPNKKWDSIEQYMNEEAPGEVHLVPEIAGAGLIAAAISAVGALVTFVAGAASLSALGSMLINLAVGFLIQGLMSLLFPVELPKTQKVATKIDTSSYIFTNLQNNAVQGFPVPLLYGELRIGSNIIATSIVNEDLG